MVSNLIKELAFVWSEKLLKVIALNLLTDQLYAAGDLQQMGLAIAYESRALTRITVLNRENS